MKTVTEIHAQLNGTGLSSTESVELIAGLMDRSLSTVWGWLGKRPAPEHTIALLNLRMVKRYLNQAE